MKPSETEQGLSNSLLIITSFVVPHLTLDLDTLILLLVSYCNKFISKRLYYIISVELMRVSN